MASKYVAAVDGVLVKVGDRIVSLYAGGVVPEGAHKEHVEVLVDRGLLVDAPKDDQGAPEEDHSDGTGDTSQGGLPAKSASRADWDAYAKSEAGGSLTDDEIAAFSTKEDLQKHYGVS